MMRLVLLVALLVGAQAVCAATTRADEAADLAMEGGKRFRSGDYREAIAAYRASAKLMPLSESHRFTLAMALIAVDDSPAARAELEALPRTSLVLYWLGRLAMQRNEIPEALVLHRQAVAADPSSVKALDGLGLAWQAAGDPENAMSAFRQAIASDRSCSAWPRQNLASLLFEQEQVMEAVEFARAAVGCDQRFAPAEYLIGRIDERAGHLAEALAWYRKAVEHDPRLRSARYALARLYGKLGEVEKQQKALAEFEGVRE